MPSGSDNRGRSGRGAGAGRGGSGGVPGGSRGSSQGGSRGSADGDRDRPARRRMPADKPVRPSGVRRQERPVDPPIDEDVTGYELDAEVRSELTSLSKIHAEAVARHLVMAARTFDDDPELAYAHAAAARRRASRMGLAREALALTAYRTGRYAEALAEFRAMRRITGAVEHWPMMADCERGLGRPHKAVEMAGAAEVRQLDAAGRIEMRIVVAGARRDLGQLDAALVTLQVPELTGPVGPGMARLRYAYADTLLAAGRQEEATDWFRRAAEIDPEGATDAAERLDEIEGIVFADLGIEPDGEPDAEDAAPR